MRLISRMKRQTSRTIWKFLEQLGNHPEVCSRRLCGVKALLPLEVVFYASGNEVVLVGIDASSAVRSELADEERFCDETPLYFSESTHRASPVWKLTKVLEVWKDFAKEFFEKRYPVRCHCVLLSHHRFINAEEMEDIWESMGVQVMHSLRQMASVEWMSLEENLGVCSEGAMSIFDERLIDCMGGFFQMEAMANGGRLYCDDDVEMKLNGLTEVEEEKETKREEPGTSGSSAEEEKSSAESFVPLSERVSDDPFDIALKKFCEETEGRSDEDEEDEDEFSAPDIPAKLRVQVLPPLKNADDVMGELLGCEGIRQQMERLTALTRYNARLRELSSTAPQHQVSLHAIFQGSPGTGKTTVCQIYASLLKRAGALSRGHVVVAGRHTFVGDKWGDEERTVSQALEAARGGVLMIDEAYLLVSAHESDPGRLILPLMMPMLADEKHRDIAVVLCGYKAPMQQLLDLNEGLRSRFTNVFDFPDFDVAQLLEIGRRRLAKYGYRLTRQARQCLQDKVTEAFRSRDSKTWGNARVMANLLDEVYVNHALRCTQHDLRESKDLVTITVADVRQVHLPTPKKERRIGF